MKTILRRDLNVRKFDARASCSTPTTSHPSRFNFDITVRAEATTSHGTDFSAPSAVFLISFCTRPKPSIGAGVRPARYIFDTPAASTVRNIEPTLCALRTLCNSTAISFFISAAYLLSHIVVFPESCKLKPESYVIRISRTPVPLSLLGIPYPLRSHRRVRLCRLASFQDRRPHRELIRRRRSSARGSDHRGRVDAARSAHRYHHDWAVVVAGRASAART